jgi:GNAT superfamily N-acetyltransferase
MNEPFAIDHYTAETISPTVLARSEAVHRQLRPQIIDYAATVKAVLAGGAEMALAADAETVYGLAIFRIALNTFDGRHLYVDDLVSNEGLRSQGVGHALIAWLEALARKRDCRILHLDSGTQRQDAHRFYLRERFVISSFHFRKIL